MAGSKHIPFPPGNEARRALDERLQREAMGDGEYDRMVAQYDPRPFKLFGIVFILAFAAAIAVLAWLGW